MSNHILPKVYYTDECVLFVGLTAPVPGIDGDGAQIAGRNSIYIDHSADGLVYKNLGDTRMPNWTEL